MNISKLKGLMAEKGHTQKELAQILEISYMQMNRKMKSKAEFKITELIKLAEIYEVDIKVFFLK